MWGKSCANLRTGTHDTSVGITPRGPLTTLAAPGLSSDADDPQSTYLGEVVVLCDDSEAWASAVAANRSGMRLASITRPF